MKKLQFNKVDIQDTLVILSLGIGFIMSIYFQMNELSMSIASGFFGYVGGTASQLAKENSRRHGQVNEQKPPKCIQSTDIIMEKKE